MVELFVLKNIITNKYYSVDKVFIEPDKKEAKKLTRGQAQALMRGFNRYNRKPNIVIESVMEI